MAGFQPNSSSDLGFVLQADSHNHSHHITSAIRTTSSFSPDISLCSRDGSIISTSSLLLSLSSPFLSNLLSTAPVSSCFPTCILLPDCSSSSLNDFISLLSTGHGASRCVGSVYRQVGEVIDTAQLLGVKFGSLSHEAVGFTGRNVFNQAHTFENFTGNELSEIADKPIQVSQPSQRSNKEQLQTFGQNNQTPQNELNNSYLVNDRFNENVQLPGVTPLKNDIVNNTKVTNDKIVDQDETTNINTSKIEQKKEEKSNREHFETSFLLCKFCEKIFVSNKELQIHLKSHQPSNNILSSQNGASIENNSEPKNHQLLHNSIQSSQIVTTEIPNYTCDNCGKTLKTKKLMNRHKLLHQDCNICDYCNKRFSREKKPEETHFTSSF